MTVHRQQNMKREDQQDATIRCLLLTSVSTCFGHQKVNNKHLIVASCWSSLFILLLLSPLFPNKVPIWVDCCQPTTRTSQTEERDASSKCRPIASGSHLQNNSISIRQGENRNSNARKLTIGPENLKYVCSWLQHALRILRHIQMQ